MITSTKGTEQNKMKTLNVSRNDLAKMIIKSMNDGGNVCVNVNGDLDVRVNGESMTDWEVIFTGDGADNCRAESDDSYSDEDIAHWIIDEYDNPEITAMSIVDGDPVETTLRVVAA